MDYQFEPDEDTLNILDKFIVKYLKMLFHLSQEESINKINIFYNSKSQDLINKVNKDELIDLLFHHDHPHFIVCNIFFQTNQNLIREYNGDIFSWMKKSGNNNMPKDLETEYKNYFESFL